MPRYSRKSQYKDVEIRSIYVLVSPISNEFFVGHCKKTLLKDVYYQHRIGTRRQTYKCMLHLKEHNVYPCFFELEEVERTKVEAYRYVIAWTKIFIDNQYVALDQGNIKHYINDMFEDVAAIYEERKDVDLKSKCNCKTCVVSNYKRKNCVAQEEKTTSKQKSDKIQIKFPVTEDEKEQIENNAKAFNKTVSAYIREVALNVNKISFENTSGTEFIDEISSLRNAINHLIFAIIKKPEYYVPTDLEHILKKINDVFKVQARFVEENRVCMERIEKAVPETIKKEVNNRIDASKKQTKTE